MADLGAEIPIIGKNNEPAGTEIQTADIVKPLGNWRKELQCQRTALGIMGTAKIVLGFIQNQIMETALGLYFLSIQKHLVSGKNLFSHGCYRAAVKSNPSLGNKFLCCPPGSCSSAA
jgi:hypothetical protein